VESFFGSLKMGLIYHTDYQTREEGETDIFGLAMATGRRSLPCSTLPLQHQPRHIRVVRRREFNKLQQRWQASIPFPDVIQLLGAPAGMVDDLVGAGMLTIRPHKCTGVAAFEK
jgi:hypothetical protein